MAALLRLVLIGFAVLTVLYAAVSLWSRETRRAKLRRRWQEEGRQGDRRAWMRAQLAEYDRSLRRRLILLIYVIPVLVVVAIIYAVNFM